MISECDTQPTDYSRSGTIQKNYSPESTETFHGTSENRTLSPMVDDDLMMKTPQSLDELLDIDNQNSEQHHSNENDEDDDGDSTCLSIDGTNATDARTEKKSIKKNGKLK